MHVSTCSSVLFYEQLPGIPTNVISPASSKLFCDLYPLKFFSDFYTLSGLKVYDTQPNLVATIILVWSGKLCALQTAGIREIGEIVRQTGKREVWIYVPLSDVYYIYIYIYIYLYLFMQHEFWNCDVGYKCTWYIFGSILFLFVRFPLYLIDLNLHMWTHVKEHP